MDNEEFEAYKANESITLQNLFEAARDYFELAVARGDHPHDAGLAALAMIDYYLEARIG